MLLSDIVWRLLQVHWQKEGHTIYRLCSVGRGEAILVPRSSGALAVVAANDGSAIGFVQLPSLPLLPPSRMPLFKQSNGSYPTLAHNCLGESRRQQSMPGQRSPRVSFKGWSTRENSIDYHTRPDQTGPDQTMALLDCG
jgi:hypothetical protein